MVKDTSEAITGGWVVMFYINQALQIGSMVLLYSHGQRGKSECLMTQFDCSLGKPISSPVALADIPSNSQNILHSGASE